MVGVGFDRDVLLEAGIQKADGLAAVTPSDEINVVAGRMAQQIFRVPRVVARVYDPRKAEIYRRLGLQTVSPVVWGVNRVAELLDLLATGRRRRRWAAARWIWWRSRLTPSCW